MWTSHKRARDEFMENNNATLSQCKCNNCSAVLEFLPEHSGARVPCPHCGVETTLSLDESGSPPSQKQNNTEQIGFHSKTGSGRTLLITGSLILFATLVYAALFKFSNLTPKQLENRRTDIQGLFGIQLGKPLPETSRISDASTPTPDEWGFISVSVTPPQPNKTFSSYLVTLTPTNHVVCSIYASGPAEELSYDVVKTLRARYGKEDVASKVAGFDPNWTWYGKESVKLWFNASRTSLEIMCEDTALSSHPAHLADTNGF